MAATKTTRRTKGTGGIYQRKSDGMWCASIELPSEGGKRRRKVIVRAKKGDVITELRAATKQLAAAGDLTTSSPTVAQWADIWWKRYAMTKLDVGTRSTYSSKIEQYIKPALGKVRLDRLNVEHVYRLHDYIQKTKDLSANSALGAHRILSSMITDAEREGRITRNVVKLANKPRIPKAKKVYLDGAEAAQVLTYAARNPEIDTATAAQWGVSILIGKRLGEVLAITKGAIDAEARELEVAWQIRRLAFQHGCGDQRADKTWPCDRKRGGNCPRRHLDIPEDQEVEQLSGGLYRTRPKARASHHILPIVGYLWDLLDAHLATRPDLGPDDLIFARPDGRPQDPAQANRDWHQLLVDAKVRDVDVHSLRHTCNTVLAELGIPVDVRKAILGQASSAVNEVYTHTSDTRVAAALTELGGAIRA